MIGLFVALLAVLAIAATASAQPRLASPDEIVIYIHKDMQNTDFVDPLLCALSKVLRVPVRTRTVDLPLTDDLLEAPSQFSPRKLAIRVGQAMAADLERAMSFRYLILDRDLKNPASSKYAFIESFHAPANIGVLSVARLAPRGAALDRIQIADVTQLRAYKLILKSIGKMSGLRGDGCVLALSRSVEEMDAKSAEFCPADHSALVNAGILKAKPFGVCNIVSMAGR